MTCRDKDTIVREALELITEEGLDGMGKAVKLLINLAMEVERDKYLGVLPYERSENRRRRRNGYKPKRVKTRVGELEFSIPQVREGKFYPKSLEKGLRSERALKLALAEMYVHGVSTRKVAAITEELCGLEISSSQVSKAANELDDILEKWQNRPLGAYRYLVLDARYEKVREGGRVLDCAVLIAVGARENGKREVLGVSVALSESEVHWHNFIRSLMERGLHGVELVISDAHEGLKSALKAVLPGVAWQRCQFHLQQNAQSYIPRQSMKKEVASSIRAIFNAPCEEEARRLLSQFVKHYAEAAPRLATWAEENIPEGFTVFRFPEEHRRRIRTSNMVERLNREINRRTRVVGIFPNSASCLRLVSAVLMEISEEWEQGRIYLRMT
ncbi:IS256 family transposase [Desulfothermus okinawensis]